MKRIHFFKSLIGLAAAALVPIKLRAAAPVVENKNIMVLKGVATCESGYTTLLLTNSEHLWYGDIIVDWHQNVFMVIGVININNLGRGIMVQADNKNKKVILYEGLKFITIQTSYREV